VPKGIRIHALGGPEVLKLEDITVPRPSAGEVQVRHTAIGLNYIDIYHRTGVYPIKLPAIIGSEAVGIVEAVGPGVTECKPGDRITYAPVIGACCDIRNLPAHRAIPVPDGLTDEAVAGMMLKGMTARALLRRAYPVKKGDTLLVHAAAGGVGLILCQWAKSLGATHVINTLQEDPVQAIRHLTGGTGVDHAFEAVGSPTLVRQAVESLAIRGTATILGVPATGAMIEFPWAALRAECRVQTSRMGSNRFRIDIPRYLEFYRQGRLLLDEMITRRGRLEDLNEAFRAMKAGEVARTILTFD